MIFPSSVLGAAVASGEVEIREPAAEVQRRATGRGPDDEPAIFRVDVAGNAFLRLRAAGNAASGLLAALEAGDRVEVRVLPPLAVEREATATSWARHMVVAPDGVEHVEMRPAAGSEP